MYTIEIKVLTRRTHYAYACVVRNGLNTRMGGGGGWTEVARWSHTGGKLIDRKRDASDR